MSYGSYDDGAEKKKKFAIIGVSSLILVAMVVAVAVGVNDKKPGSDAAPAASGGGDQISTSTKAVESICQPTNFKDACRQSLSKANSSDPHKLVQAAFSSAIDSIATAIEKTTAVQEADKNPMAKKALQNCKVMMNAAIEDLKTSVIQVGDFSIAKLDDHVDNLKIWLSSTITYQITCTDQFDNNTGEAGRKMKQLLNLSSQLTSNGLVMVTSLSSLLSDLNLGEIGGRKLLTETKNGEMPSWVTPAKRRLLQDAPSNVKADIVVASDGSGQFKTINDAVKTIPLNSPMPFVIHVKAGVYNEIVAFSRNMTNIVLMGDGPSKTVISGKQSFADGMPIINTATVTVSGAHFIAKDIGFENTAGPEGHSAVALLSESDMSIFYNCQFSGFQNTLYALTYRQFYRDCTISGTIDMIFGDSASVFQNCKMVVRKPLDMQKCTITAQGRNDTRQPTGFVIQNSTITADKDFLPVKTETPAFLGRPQYPFSRTIIMQTQIDDMIDPTGWLPFMGTFGIDTCYYAEYQNKGPGADTKKRVTWKGIKQIKAEEAAGFKAAKFLGGDAWIPTSGVPYSPAM